MAENNSSKGLSVEGAGIYVIGLCGLGVVGYLAKKYFDDLERRATTGNTPTNVATAPAVLISQPPPNGTPTPHINTNGSEMVDGITIPAPSGGGMYSGQNAPSDEFPLRFGQGGARILNVQTAFAKLRLMTGDKPTGYFHNFTQAAITKYFGKLTMDKADYVKLMRASGQLGGISSLRGVGASQVPQMPLTMAQMRSF